jgi:Mg2+-importing ATPase
MSHVERYWAQSDRDVLGALNSGVEGLTGTAAALRLRQFGRNALSGPSVRPWVGLLVSRFANPLVIILVVAALVSLIAREWVDAGIVLGIIALTAILSFAQEYRASLAIEALRRRVSVTADVIRDNVHQTIPADRVVPGDIIELSAGTLVPADALLLEARDLFVNQSMLTGETLPMEKHPGVCAVEATLASRTNCVFMGTSVRSGWGRAVAVDTGRGTVFGGIAVRLKLRPTETEFERGLRRLGGFLIRLMLTVVVAVLAIDIMLHRPTIDTLLFAAALAVGLSPELLPAILTITLSHGARAMAREGVIVKRLNAIENLGSMDVLCTDKTGTLTRGVIALDDAVDPDGQRSTEVLRLAILNARLQTGIRNALDDAVVARSERDGLSRAVAAKLDEIPYDFQRRRLSIVVSSAAGSNATLITKGAVENVLMICNCVRIGQQELALDESLRDRLMKRFVDWSTRGFRVLAVASKPLAMKERYGAQDEAGMALAGFLLFFDPPEPQVKGALTALEALGVDVKVVTGDNRFVAAHVAETIGMTLKGTLTGDELQRLSDEALWQRAPSITLFAEIEPNQKERIITALRKTGHVVGYLGDGINDAPALHAADVGISVDTAVDVAKDAADFVLLKHDLKVIHRGIDEGRHTFANTIKYIFIATSGNFGNMISMALASVYLPFLPLLAKQILLNNFLSDIPGMGVAGDNVDREWERTPHRWDIPFIRRSMLTFGLTSTAFDLITFAALLKAAGGDHAIFRTGWFLESLLTQLWTLLVIRTYRPFYRSRPGRFLAWSTGVMTLIAVTLPYAPGSDLLGFVALPAPIVMAVMLIAVLFVVAMEAIKRPVYRRIGGSGRAR